MNSLKTMIAAAMLVTATAAHAAPINPNNFDINSFSCAGCSQYFVENRWNQPTADGNKSFGAFFQTWQDDLSVGWPNNLPNGKLMFDFDGGNSKLFVDNTNQEVTLLLTGQVYTEIYSNVTSNDNNGDGVITPDEVTYHGPAQKQTYDFEGYMQYFGTQNGDSPADNLAVERSVNDRGHLSFGGYTLDFTSKENQGAALYTNPEALAGWFMFFLPNFASLNGVSFGGITGDINARLSAVPEPATMILLGSGLGALGLTRRRKKVVA